MSAARIVAEFDSRRDQSGKVLMWNGMLAPADTTPQFAVRTSAKVNSVIWAHAPPVLSIHAIPFKRLRRVDFTQQREESSEFRR